MRGKQGREGGRGEGEKRGVWPDLEWAELVALAQDVGVGPQVEEGGQHLDQAGQGALVKGRVAHWGGEGGGAGVCEGFTRGRFW